MLQKQPRKGANGREKGFSLLELLIVVGMVAILAAVAVPSILKSIPRYKLKGAARTLVNDFQKAKVEAVKRNCTVQIQLTPAAYAPAGKAGSYQIVETDGNTVLLSRQMPEFVTLYSSNFSSNIAGYTSQGLPSNGLGSVYLRNNRSTYYQLSLSIAGNVSLSMNDTGVFP